MTKKALGKGLKAFLPEEYGILKEERFLDIAIDRLKPNPHQPRKKWDPKALEELAQSIQETGILQPIVVVPDEENYTIIVGERRWRAAKKIGLQTIPVLIRNLTETQQHEAMLIENLQREDLNPIEIAKAYQKMTQNFSYTQEDVAKKVGKDRASVANTLRLLKLPGDIQELIQEGKLSMGHARALIPVEDPERQRSMAKRIVKDNLSVRGVEKWVRRLQAPTEKLPKAPMDPDLLIFQEELLMLLGTKVVLSGDQNKGVLKIFYYTLDDLNRIYEKIKGVHT
ncbi:MAG: ParB/RepB/Spo0J family partition protein [Candidatus Aminicenantaceae bacterium]|nr:ParB/RepB/Spo0J family partition protein [Candidatus Heimdallarchaeota archaeon]